MRPRRISHRLALSLGAALLALAALGLLLVDSRSTAWIKAHTTHVFDRKATLDRKAAEFVFDLSRIQDRFHYDPVALLAFDPDVEQRYAWKEHPAGAFTLRTNNRGLREDQPTALEKRGTRILVAGDSHTAGLVDNAETFSNQLESRLRRATGEAELEVLNAGVAYTGPSCYLGTLQKNLELAPDVFVAVVFTGNDFWDELKLGYVMDGWTPPIGDEAYQARIEAAAERWSGPISQGFNQLYRWKHFPWERERAVDLALRAILAMRELCATEGIPLLVVLLPTKMEVEPEDDAETQAEVVAALDLEPGDLSANRDLALQLLQRLENAGVATLDLLPALAAADHPLYWREDYHLGLSGHARVAALLEERLLPLLAGAKNVQKK